MKSRWLCVGGLGLLALAAAACAPRGGAVTLQGTTWMLTALNGKAPVAGSTITAVFDETGKISGSSGCNSYTASYHVSGSRLTIDQTVSTMMACEPRLMQQETAYLMALAATASYGLQGDQLSLKDASGAAILLYSAQSTSLAGTSWTATGYNNGQGAVQSVVSGTTLTADFAAGGTLSGSAGCNTYNAAYTTDGSKLSIGPVATTRMYCAEPQGVMDQEAQYLAALGTAASYSISGSKLELRTADGALAAAFQPAGR
jgi:heat shock protein HslJ